MNLLDIARAALPAATPETAGTPAQPAGLRAPAGAPLATNADTDVIGAATRARWLVQSRDRAPLKLFLTEAITNTVVRAPYPDAVAAVPIEHWPSRATHDQVADLRALFAIVAADWPPDAQAEALAVALADPEFALMCFRALAADLARSAPDGRDDDPQMRSCRDCLNLAPSGACLAARRGESFGVGIVIGRNYVPLPGVPQRCGAYAPGPDDPDRRSGRERWTLLFLEPGQVIAAAVHRKRRL